MKNSTHPLYSIWKGMRGRCQRPTNRRFVHYGGRGIKVCERWESLENFAADMGERPHNHTIDRIDNDGDYCPENCRWVPLAEQARNKRNNVRLFFNGENLTVSEWARKIGIEKSVLFNRLRRGWSVERILTEPIVPPEKRYTGTPWSLIPGSLPIKFYTFDGKTLPMKEWSKITGVKYKTICERLRRGWSLEKTLTTPTP